MSISFYYVLTYNVQHPTVKRMIGGLIDVSESMLEFKVRSKLYHSFEESSEGAYHDFDLKSEILYTDEEVENKNIRWLTATNPAFELEDGESPQTDDWEPGVAGTIFFLEVDGPAPETDEDEELSDEEAMMMVSHSWMFKYELKYSMDAIENCVNGEAIFTPALSGITSSYH